MSELPPPYSYEQSYVPASPYGNARTLVKVVGIFNLIMCGMDILYGAGLLVLGLMLITGVINDSTFNESGATIVTSSPPVSSSLTAPAATAPVATGPEIIVMTTTSSGVTAGVSPAPPTRLIGGVSSGLAMFALGVGIIKLIAGLKLLRLRPGAWGWGLTAGIVGCTQLWCVYFCVLPMAVGIFTIIVMSLETVRRFLRDAAAVTAT